MNIVFLGTGGGRFVTYAQMRWTGGIRLVSGGLHVHVDPGPGAIVRSTDAGLSPEKIRLLLVSHSHPDHYGDAETVIEGMTRGTTRRRGTLVASTSVLNGEGVVERSISKYHQGLVGNVVEASPGSSFEAEGIGIYVTKAVHSDPSTVGYILDFPHVGRIGYTSDTEFFDGIADYYKGLTVLVLCVLRPRGSSLRYHLCTDDARVIIEATRPKTAVLTHFGMKMLSANPAAEASYIRNSTGIRTIAAADGMTLSVAGGTVSSETGSIRRAFRRRKLSRTVQCPDRQK